jgi:hypothetical protein
MTGRLDALEKGEHADKGAPENDAVTGSEGCVTSAANSTTSTRRNLIRIALVWIGFTALQAAFQYTSSLLPGSSVTSLHPKFIRQCHHLLQPHANTQTSRLSALAAVLASQPLRGANDTAVWIAEPGPSAFYYTGAFGPGDWHLSERPFLIAIHPNSNSPAPAQITILTPEFEELRAQLLLPKALRHTVNWVSWKEHESPYAVLREAMGGVRAVVLDGHAREFVAAGLRAELGEDRLREGEHLKGPVGLIREVKDEREIGLLRCANQVRPVTNRRGGLEARTGPVRADDCR